MMRVLEFVTNFCVGGTERQFVNLVDGLRRRDVDVHLACFDREGPLRAELHRPDLPDLPLGEYRVRSLRSPATAWQLAALTRYLRRHRIDVVHTTGLYPNVFGVLAARLAGTPAVVSSVRDMGHMWSPTLLQAQRFCSRFADAVVTNAEAVARRLRAEGYPGEKLEVIHNGLAAPPDDGFGASGPPVSLREELGIPPGAPLVGSICRLDPVKGLEDLIDAAALVVGRHPEVRFLVVGGPPAMADWRTGEAYVASLRERAERLGLGERVIFTGARKDVPRILNELSVAALSSHSEGLSNSLLEAMAAGRPVVATDVGGNPEIVDDGATGFLVPARDPAAFAVALCRLLSSAGLASEMGQAGRVRVTSRFTHERMVDRTLELYRRLLAEARGRSLERVPVRGTEGAPP